jgi:HEAT repeats
MNMMKRLQGVLLLVIVLAWTAPAPGQWIFAKRPKINPSQRVPELILTVKIDPDERKRHDAAEELRNYDVTTFTEIVPVLVDVLENDKKHGVRAEALTSLTKIRPATLQAGRAIEKAASKDDNLLVRLQAKAALPKYHLVLSTTKKSDPAPTKKTTNEPPLLIQPAPPAIIVPPAKVPPPVQGPSLFPE